MDKTDVIRIAARVSVPELCPVCKSLMLYDDGRDAYVCICGFVGDNGPTKQHEFEKIASMIASNSSSQVNCSVEILLSVYFKGNVSDSVLSKKIKSEMFSSIESAITITAKELQIEASDISVKPPVVKITSIP